MEYLIELLESLNRGEQELLHRNLSANPNLERTKLIKRLLARDKAAGTSYENIGLTKTGNYQLAYKTKEWLFSLILQQDGNSKIKSEVGKKRYEIYKYMLYAFISINHGLRRDSIVYLVKAQKLARKYEFISLEMEIVNELLWEYVNTNKFKLIEKLKKRQFELEYLLRAYNQAYWIRYELYNNRLSTANWDNVNKRLFKSQLDDLMRLADESGLLRIKSDYLRTCFVYYAYVRDFEQVLKMAKTYLKLVDQSPMLRGNGNKGGGNMIIATTLNRLGKFKKAEQYAENALKLFSKKFTNNEVASHVLFTSIFNLKKYKEALLLAKKFQRSKLLKKYPMRREKWHFFEAAIRFKLGEYDLSMKALRNCNEILKDKSGWQYGYRILEILIQYENGGAEILDNYILNFRRFIRGHTVQSKTRISLILKVLSALEKSQFNFKRIARSHVGMLRTLEEGKGLYFYEPSGFELIRFDQWFRKHLKKAK